VTSPPPYPPVKASFEAGNLVAVKDRLRSIDCVGLLLLIGCAFYLDVSHGMRLGQDQVAFVSLGAKSVQ
jgi:hypothetical protein